MIIRKVFNNYSGKGKIKTEDGGAVYDGDWAGGIPHGKGKMTYPDGSVYEGDFVNGKRSSKGFLGGLFGKK